MQHSIILISPYEDEYLKLKKCLLNSYVLYYFDSFKNAELFLEEHDNVGLVLLSSSTRVKRMPTPQRRSTRRKTLEASTST